MTAGCRLDIAPVPYQGAACMTLALDRDVTDGIYWLNMKDAAPYGAVVSHTNFAPLAWYGEHLVYLASYFAGRLPEGFEQTMLADFCRRFSVSASEVHWHRLRRPMQARSTRPGSGTACLPTRSTGSSLPGCSAPRTTRSGA